MKRKIAVVIVLCLLITASLTDSKSYAAGGSWKSDSSGWWYEYSDGSYAMGWTEIDGYWYFFTGSGYMDYSEYRDGCWLNADGTWNTAYSGGYWASDSTGWWYTDASGWYPVSTWLWIDGSCYYFKASGYMAKDEYIDGCYVDSTGAYVKGATAPSGSHTHTWICTKDAWDEQVLVKDAWDEKVPKYEYKEKVHYYCANCHAELANDQADCACGGLTCYCETTMDEVLVGYDTVHHDAEYKTVHHDAEYTCSTCGAKW